MRPQINRTGLWQGWVALFEKPEIRRAKEHERRLRQEMEAARQEVELAERYFQTVTDPELVDHAIYVGEAAKRKYRYLFRQLRCSLGGTVESIQQVQEEAEWM